MLQCTHLWRQKLKIEASNVTVSGTATQLITWVLRKMVYPNTSKFEITINTSEITSYNPGMHNPWAGSGPLARFIRPSEQVKNTRSFS